MDQEAVAIITEALKADSVNLVVTLPEEPTSALIHALREDLYFTIVDAASEGSGIAAAAGASLSGRRRSSSPASRACLSAPGRCRRSVRFLARRW